MALILDKIGCPKYKTMIDGSFCQSGLNNYYD
ncbi:MAG: hypothetical protein JWQ96_3458 [Segetibacter sp.]|nr:hypothetical protein [Segetibacter sp.]